MSTHMPILISDEVIDPFPNMLVKRSPQVTNPRDFQSLNCSKTWQLCRQPRSLKVIDDSAMPGSLDSNSHGIDFVLPEYSGMGFYETWTYVMAGKTI